MHKALGNGCLTRILPGAKSLAKQVIANNHARALAPGETLWLKHMAWAECRILEFEFGGISFSIWNVVYHRCVDNLRKIIALLVYVLLISVKIVERELTHTCVFLSGNEQKQMEEV
ncbi:hypothetical protein MTR_8g022320 [Medicago truncatula]|uniref:Uncharacterized protein n=1 Tax=Medicago truncatula TaxID=3880 RepID=G7L8D2_MEDTR|nr:hypothetical protein MTR_8g022320 [Medicago truncatula]